MSSESEENSVTSVEKSSEKPNALSFFTANDDDSSSESDNECDKHDFHKEPITTPETCIAVADNKLPSPSTLFATVGKPKFLETALKPNEVDWNSISRRFEPLYEYSSVSCPAESVDLESEERNEASISGAPIKYKTEISETKRHLFLHGKRSADLTDNVDVHLADKDVLISEKKKKTS
ncbi:uncharacterized protein LOC124439277 [Xenia sp. Carnegie-2017]|uniref:uncharacterized protein LOC124439277 n=1 Tax=Xenia sp. Carnegie-2017 TaxID=2897299 RepID=UPI001F048D38|nr:uncharacterized protein LOC124439277 [Xenia sp. Carnegie-2017]